MLGLRKSHSQTFNRNARFTDITFLDRDSANYVLVAISLTERWQFSNLTVLERFGLFSTKKSNRLVQLLKGQRKLICMPPSDDGLSRTHITCYLRYCSILALYSACTTLLLWEDSNVQCHMKSKNQNINTKFFLIMINCILVSLAFSYTNYPGYFFSLRSRNSQCIKCLLIPEMPKVPSYTSPEGSFLLSSRSSSFLIPSCDRPGFLLPQVQSRKHLQVDGMADSGFMVAWLTLTFYRSCMPLSCHPISFVVWRGHSSLVFPFDAFSNRFSCAAISSEGTSSFPNATHAFRRGLSTELLVVFSVRVSLIESWCLFLNVMLSHVRLPFYKS